jgi:hypothetical protein
MGDIRERLQKLERLVGEKLVCAECSSVAIIVIRPGEDGTSKMPGRCPTCGRERNVIVVTSPLPGRVGSMKAASDGIDAVGSPEIDDPGPGRVIAPRELN